MEEVEIKLRPGKETLELCEFLTIKGLANSGGHAKLMIQSGEVKLNGIVETRKRKKIDSGDKITIGENKYHLTILSDF